MHAVLGTAGLTCVLLLAAPAAAQHNNSQAQRGAAFRPAPSYRPPPQPSYRAPQPAFGPSRAPAGYRAPAYSAPPAGYGARAPQGFYGQQNGAAAPIERRPPQNAAPNASVSAAPPLRPNSLTGTGARGEHLMDWMNAHSNLTPQQQQDALGREPGFRDLPGQTQQRIRDRLSELDAMPPQQRQRMVAHTEQMERLNPAQRAEVRGAMLQLGSLPREQQRAVSQAFRELRTVPPEQRESMLNARYGNLSPQQRYTLDRLMQVEPMLPPPER